MEFSLESEYSRGICIDDNSLFVMCFLLRTVPASSEVDALLGAYPAHA
jgi:hypothetical protein